MPQNVLISASQIAMPRDPMAKHLCKQRLWAKSFTSLKVRCCRTSAFATDAHPHKLTTES